MWFEHLNFDLNFDIETVDFEIYIGNALAQRQRMQAPKEMLMANFLQTMQQIGNDKRPMKIKMVRQVIVEDKIENKDKALNCDVTFSNNAMIAFEGDKEE